MERVDDRHSRYVRGLGDRLEKNGWWHSFELPGGRLIQGANSLEGLKERVAGFPIAADLRGKRVLDIGAWDGWFSFEMERRGASVVSVDCFDNKNFRYLHRELGSKIDYRIMDMYELTRDKLGTFDIVLFLGVLYHLKHPLLALERVCSLTRDLCIVETLVCPEPGPPIMEFYETDELAGGFDNWVAPNIECVMAMSRAAGFARANLLRSSKLLNAAAFACFRRFEEPAPPLQPAPVLGGAAHMSNFGINFRSDLDEYASAWFTLDVPELVRTEVQAEVGPFHSPIVGLAKTESGWQANFKIPPGLDPGWYEVRVRTSKSEWSNALKVAIDQPLKIDSLAITGAADGRAWTPFEVQTGEHGALSVWVDGLPANADRHNVELWLGGTKLDSQYISPWDPAKPSQINAWLPPEIAPGAYSLTATAGGKNSEPVRITCK